ncbi:hypothetical protein ATANTOWER_025374 [Ataeniobius toweri]|uniref:Uncharacterized protein n=1 Tax=Ataeniobius toweri TaxID=208326 RepID=A0ABU7B9F6_9TELE|nr:hypothetical protein [Ataeniobius toweri]
MGRTADLKDVQKTVMDTFHKEDPRQGRQDPGTQDHKRSGIPSNINVMNQQGTKATKEFKYKQEMQGKPLNRGTRVAGELVPIYSSLRVRVRVHPGQVGSPSHGNTETHRSNNHAHTHSHLRARLFISVCILRLFFVTFVKRF